MIDEELEQAQDPVIEIPPDVVPGPSTVPEPVPTAPPMEVVPVDEVLDRIGEILSIGDDVSEETEEPTEAPTGEPEEIADPGDNVAVELDPGTLAIMASIDGFDGELALLSDQLIEIQQHLARPALTTPFEDYTVSEALLLLLLLCAFVSACVRMLKGGFSWLRS